MEVCWFEVMDDLPLRCQLWKGSQLDQPIWDLVFLSVKEDKDTPTCKSKQFKIMNHKMRIVSNTWQEQSCIPDIDQLMQDVQAGLGEVDPGCFDERKNVCSC